MAAQRIRRAGVDPSVLHYALSATQMKSGLVHLHLVRYVVSPRAVEVQCMAEVPSEPLTLKGVYTNLAYALELAAPRIVPGVDLDQLGLFD